VKQYARVGPRHVRNERRTFTSSFRSVEHEYEEAYGHAQGLETRGWPVLGVRDVAGILGLKGQHLTDLPITTGHRSDRHAITPGHGGLGHAR
jgi:hypothetical protein